MDAIPTPVIEAMREFRACVKLHARTVATANERTEQAAVHLARRIATLVTSGVNAPGTNKPYSATSAEVAAKVEEAYLKLTAGVRTAATAREHAAAEVEIARWKVKLAIDRAQPLILASAADPMLAMLSSAIGTRPAGETDVGADDVLTDVPEVAEVEE